MSDAPHLSLFYHILLRGHHYDDFYNNHFIAFLYTFPTDDGISKQYRF